MFFVQCSDEKSQYYILARNYPYNVIICYYNLHNTASPSFLKMFSRSMCVIVLNHLSNRIILQLDRLKCHQYRGSHVAHSRLQYE